MRHVTIGAVLLGLVAGALAADRSGGNTSPAATCDFENVARGKPYTMTPAPNYRHCTDPADKTQLTDGTYTRGYFWTQKSTVGWRLGPPTFVSIDLGSVQPIKGVSWSTAAGVAGVRWPEALLVFVSSDGKTWHETGDLVQLAAPKSSPPKEGYATHVYRTDGLKTRGRFVRIAALACGPYVFVDEIEVFKGDASLLEQPEPGRPVNSPRAAVASRHVTRLVQAQFRRDLAAARLDLEAQRAGSAERTRLTQAANRLAEKIETMPVIAAEGFRAVLPMTPLEREVFGFQAAVWRGQKKPPLRLWQSHRWDPLAPSAEPSAATPPVCRVHAMVGETRADVLNLTSARRNGTTVRLRIDGLPGGTNPDYVAVHEVLHVGTRHFVAVAAALPRARRDGGHYVVTVPAGMTRQVWFSFDAGGIRPGAYAGKVVLDDGDAAHSVPIRLKVYPLRMPDAKTLRLGGWSYTNGRGSYGVTPANRDAFIAHLRAHGVNAPWATSAAMPPGTYDDAGNLAEKPDTTNFDEWVRRWPGAACYMVFASVGSYASVRDAFAGSKVGTPLFEKKVAAWIRFWARHVRDLGLKAGQLGLLLVDEPNRKEQYDVIRAWAQIIRKTEPEVLVWEDPCPRAWDGFDEMARAVDVLVPNRSHWLTRDEAFRNRFRRQRDAGRQLGFYSCAGPARCFDPFAYYLLQQWHCFKEGATWSGFWAFGDNARQSCWNEYLAQGNGPYCPLYLDETSVTGAKYMEAIREGVQDYEYLGMLRDRIAALEKAGRKTAALPRARALLAGACDRVLAEQKDANYRWDKPKDRTVADTVRIEVLEILAALAGD